MGRKIATTQQVSEIIIVVFASTAQHSLPQTSYRWYSWPLRRSPRKWQDCLGWSFYGPWMTSFQSSSMWCSVRGTFPNFSLHIDLMVIKLLVETFSLSAHVKNLLLVNV